MNGSKKMELLGSAPIPKALMALGIPTMVGMLINALYNLVDPVKVQRKPQCARLWLARF